MSRKYKFTDQDKLYFVSFAVINWIDLFIRRQYKDIIKSSLAYCQKEKGLELYGWCIMTSHISIASVLQRGLIIEKQSPVCGDRAE